MRLRWWAKRSIYNGHFNARHYLQSNADVAKAGVNPLRHYLRSGWREDRRPTPTFSPLAYLGANPDVKAAGVEPFRHYLEFGLKEGRPLALSQPRGGAAKVISPGLREFARRMIDPAEYFANYPQTAQSGIAAVDHWLTVGVPGGSPPARGVQFILGPRARWATGDGWHQYEYDGQSLAIRIDRLPASIASQIREQTSHEPALTASGARAYEWLRHARADDLNLRDGVDPVAIKALLKEEWQVVLIIPRLVIGGAEKYAADIAGAFVRRGLKVLVLVTEQSSSEAGEWCQFSILHPFRRCRVVFCWDISAARGNEYCLARILNAIRPRSIFVVNSRPGMDMVVTYGRALSQFAHLFCAYFSVGGGYTSGPYGNRFPRITLPYATALTDNDVMAEWLRARYAAMPSAKIEVLHPAVSIVPAGPMADRIERNLRYRSAGPRKWLWISRVEPFKGTAILAAIAATRPDETFHVFGPIQGSLAAQKLNRENLVYRGEIRELAAIDLLGFSGFLFTSLSEGMPNIALEMSQLGLPMILADVGGLRDTFGDQGALLVGVDEDFDRSAQRFCDAMDRLLALSCGQLEAMAWHAYEAVRRRHSLDDFSSRLYEMAPA